MSLIKKKVKKATLSKNGTGSDQTKITVERVNDIQVKPIKIYDPDEGLLPKGYEMFPIKHPCVFLCAHRNSGKTMTICNILKYCSDKDSTILLISGTANTDPVWLSFRKYCKKVGIRFESVTEIKSNLNGKKSDFLDDFIESEITKKGNEEEIDKSDDDEEEEMKTSLFAGIDQEDEYDEEEEEDEVIPLKSTIHPRSKMIFSKLKDETSMKVKKSYYTPKYFVILDDLSSELKTPSLENFLKIARHGKVFTICSSQYIHDIKPTSIKQCEYILLFKGNLNKLEKIRVDCGLSIDLPTLEKVYLHATKDPYNFLYISTRTNEYRKNFDQKYHIPVKEEI
jgi:hypothetical protein